MTGLFMMDRHHQQPAAAMVLVLDDVYTASVTSYKI